MSRTASHSLNSFKSAQTSSGSRDFHTPTGRKIDTRRHRTLREYPGNTNFTHVLQTKIDRSKRNHKTEKRNHKTEKNAFSGHNPMKINNGAYRSTIHNPAGRVEYDIFHGVNPMKRKVSGGTRRKRNTKRKRSSCRKMFWL
jgi:hypothetical protein